MKFTITCLLTVVCALNAMAQTFEGKINYTNTYKSNTPVIISGP
jgi:hypothetical protein